MANLATPQRPSAGWEALRAAEWEQARAAFEAELASNETAEALDGLAQARWWLSDIPGAIEAWEMAYMTHRRDGLDEPAAHVAVLLSREHAEALGNHALANGWLARARDLLEGSPDSAEWGWVALVESERAVDPAVAQAHAERALGVARRTRDPDLELAALGRAGLAEIALGRLEEGMTRFDEGMAASAAGESSDLRTIGDLYCAAVLASEITLDTSRFEQWTAVVMGFMERTGHPDLLTFCGTCCAEVLRAEGQWEEGEGWLTRTLSRLEQSGQKARCVHPATRLASFRISQGRLEEAEVLLRGYEDLPEAVQAMVALHSARGQTALAAARLHRRLNEIGRDNLVAVPLLAQLVEVQLAQPDHVGAAEAADALAAIASRSGQARAEAEAELAFGSVRAAVDDPAAAREHLDRSLGLFVRLRMPHAVARAHLAMAQAIAGTDRDTAVEEARQALRTFEDLGATRDADRAAAFLRSIGVAGRTGPKLLGDLSKREVEVLRLLGEGMTNAEIAARLYISTKTVATHVGNLFAKLQLRNRAEAAAFASRHLPADAAAP
ncbi:MAG TPA: LuxR C-terminal-related transcriptional regulator [Actinomycetota bacterium]